MVPRIAASRRRGHSLWMLFGEQRLHRGEKAHEVERLLKESRFEARGIFSDVGVSRKNQYRDRAQLGTFVASLQESRAIHDRHFPVQKNQLSLLACEYIE